MKMLSPKSFSALALLLLLSNFARAGLQWNTTAVLLETKRGDEFADAAFPFKNTGTDSVWITSVDTSCSCLTPNQVIGVYKPGQSGTVTVRYKVGARSGTMTETVTVHTSDPAAQTVSLDLTVYVPITYRLEPTMLLWDTGAPAIPHDAYFYDLRGTGMKPVFVYSPNTNFTATVVPQPEMHRYAIHVVPVSTDNEDATRIYIDVDVGGGKIQKTKIIVAVRTPGSTQPIKLSQ
jgi:hypothetical protein